MPDSENNSIPFFSDNSSELLFEGNIEPLLDGVNVWLNVYDRYMNLIFWNSTAEKVSGYERREVLGNDHIWEWLYPDKEYRTYVTRKAESLLEAESEMDRFETEILCKNGTGKTISWSSRTLLDNKGSICGAITFGRDVTDRNRAEAALHKAHEELSVLYNIASVTSGAMDLNIILDRSLEHVLPVLESDKGIIHLKNEVSGRLQVAAYRGLDESSVSELVAFSSDAGIFRKVYDTQTPFALPNITELFDDGPTNLPSKLFNAYLGVPMRARGKLLGVFSILGKAGRRFSEDEITMVASIADQIGTAVENARLYEQARALAVSEERRRLARDLHDAVTQSLYSLTLFAEAGHRSLKNGDLKNTDRYLAELGTSAQDALKEMRLLLHELRPLQIETEGLAEAIQHRLDSVEGRLGISARLENDTVGEFPPETEGMLYRIVQEALNNALRHASAKNVTVKIEDGGGAVVVTVRDNGIGFNLNRAYSQGGMGLESMSERAASIGAAFHIETSPGRGTLVTISVPAEKNGKGEARV